jgi:hypothetical protein
MTEGHLSFRPPLTSSENTPPPTEKIKSDKQLEVYLPIKANNVLKKMPWTNKRRRGKAKSKSITLTNDDCQLIKHQSPRQGLALIFIRLKLNIPCFYFFDNKKMAACFEAAIMGFDSGIGQGQRPSRLGRQRISFQSAFLAARL